MARGGKRLGAGRPKGPSPSTLDKIAAREFTRAYVTARLEPMLRSQVAHAQGIGHLYTRDKAGKFTKVENPELIDALLADPEKYEGEHYWIFTKDPSVQAFTDLLNRALDKPTEQVQVSGKDGGPLVVSWKSS